MNEELVQKETKKEPILSKLKYYISQVCPETIEDELKLYKNKRELLSIEQNVVLWEHRIIIPESM